MIKYHGLSACLLSILNDFIFSHEDKTFAKFSDFRNGYDKSESQGDFWANQRLAVLIVLVLQKKACLTEISTLNTFTISDQKCETLINLVNNDDAKESSKSIELKINDNETKNIYLGSDLKLQKWNLCTNCKIINRQFMIIKMRSLLQALQNIVACYC